MRVNAHGNREPITRDLRLGTPLLLVLLVVMLIITGCRQPQPNASAPKTAAKPGSQSPPQKTPVQEKQTAEVHAAEITWPDAKGRPVWKAKFKEASFSQSGKSTVAELRDVSASLYRDGKAVSSLTAQRVVADDKTKEVIASGAVKIVSLTNGAVAKCDKLTWKASENKVYGAGGVSFVQDNVTITSNRVVTDTALQHAVFSD